jgi:hypothetical protein
MKHVKSMYRTSLSDMHLKSILMTVSTKIVPHLVDKILLGKHQYHISYMWASPCNNFRNNEIIYCFLKLHPFSVITASGMLKVRDGY